MNIKKTKIDDVFTIEPDLFSGERGYFWEAYNRRNFKHAVGFDVNFVQDNQSQSSHKILRGLHYQTELQQDKLVRAIEGVIYDVAVDLRTSSKTFGKWVAVELSDTNKKQIFIPKGFAHGFLVLSHSATVLYKTSDYYNPAAEHSLRWNCPNVGIDWPIKDPILNKRDAHAPGINDCEFNL